MKQVHINFDLSKNNFEHAYDIKESNTCCGKAHILTRSDNNTWSAFARGEEAMRITDTGNELKICLEEGETIELDYHLAEELFILLSQLQFAKIKILNTKTEFEWPSSQ